MSEELSAEYLSGQVVDASVDTRGGREGKGTIYIVEDDEGRRYTCDYTDIVTEGFRTLRPGDVVRFTPIDDTLGRFAQHVLKLNEPTGSDFYGEVEPSPNIDLSGD